jgi:hypothetical protein
MKQRLNMDKIAKGLGAPVKAKSPRAGATSAPRNSPQKLASAFAYRRLAAEQPTLPGPSDG